ncbi:MAG: hypothetical protein ABI614_26100, partial [Planctomycetota bacterium]
RTDSSLRHSAWSDEDERFPVERAGPASSVETAMIYIHVLNSGGRGVRSPLAQLTLPAGQPIPATIG